MRGQFDADRPRLPDTSLLAAAAATLQDLLQSDEVPEWMVLSRDVRRRSTLFRLAAAHRAGTTYAWAKIDAPWALSTEQDKLERQVARFRDSLEFEEQVSPALALELGARGVSFDRPLAVDIERLSAVRLEVPGRQLGRVLSFAVPGRRRAGLAALAQAGAATRSLEAVSRSFGASFDLGHLQRRVEADLQGAGCRLDSGVQRRISNYAHELVAGIDLTRSAVRGHGDLSPTNILVDSGRLGLIDFSWRRYIAGESVAHLVARLGVESWTPAPWKRAAVAAVLRGYRCDTVESWQLAYLLRLLRWSSKASPERADWALKELRLLIADL